MSAEAIDARHQALAELLPAQPEALWDALGDMNDEQKQSLFAHCIACTVNATFEAYNRRPRALGHADQLAAAVDLDMAAAGWTPDADGFLGRVTKARILQAVAEAKGERAAESIAHLKKSDMAARAEVLLEGTGWLPEPLRTPGHALPSPVVDDADSLIDEAVNDVEVESAADPAAEDGGRSMADEEAIDDTAEAEGDTPSPSPPSRSRSPDPLAPEDPSFPRDGPLSVSRRIRCVMHPTSRSALPAMRKASAAIICPKAADKVVTGSSAMSKVRPDAACSCD